MAARPADPTITSTEEVAQGAGGLLHVLAPQPAALVGASGGPSFSLLVEEASSAMKVIGGGEKSVGRMYGDSGGMCGRSTAPLLLLLAWRSGNTSAMGADARPHMPPLSLYILPAESSPSPSTLFAEDAFSDEQGERCPPLARRQAPPPEEGERAASRSLLAPPPPLRWSGVRAAGPLAMVRGCWRRRMLWRCPEAWGHLNMYFLAHWPCSPLLQVTAACQSMRYAACADSNFTRLRSACQLAAPHCRVICLLRRTA
jgi:hypothetical protein